MQTDEYIARRVELEDVPICKNLLDQRHAISEACDFVAQLHQQTVAYAACLRIIDLDHQVCGIVGRKCALKCLDCAELIFSYWIACGFHDANKDQLISGKAELRAVRTDSAKLLQRMLSVNRRRSRYVSLEGASQILRTRYEHIELFERFDPDLRNDWKLPPEISRIHDVITQLDPAFQDDVGQRRDRENDQADTVRKLVNRRASKMRVCGFVAAAAAAGVDVEGRDGVALLQHQAYRVSCNDTHTDVPADVPDDIESKRPRQRRIAGCGRARYRFRCSGRQPGHVLSTIQTAGPKSPEETSFHHEPCIPGDSLAQSQPFWQILVPALNQILELRSDNLLGKIRFDEPPPVLADLQIEGFVAKQADHRVCERIRIVPSEHVHSRRQVESLQACTVSDYGQAEGHRLCDLAFQPAAESHRRNRDVAGTVNFADVGHETEDFHVRSRQRLHLVGW